MCSSKLTGFLELGPLENCSLLGTDNVSEQLSEHVFVPDKVYCSCMKKLGHSCFQLSGFTVFLRFLVDCVECMPTIFTASQRGNCCISKQI